MKPIPSALLLTTLCLPYLAGAQQKAASLPEFALNKAEASAHMYFLASDELEGRRTGEQSNRVAARYIAEQFRKYGVTPVPGQQDYFQPVLFEKTAAAGKGLFIAGNDTLKNTTEWLQLSGNAAQLDAPVVYAGYGLEDPSKGWDDYKGLDVRGKVVLVQAGLPESQTPRENLAAATQKQVLAAGKGAVAIVELYGATTPWNVVAPFLAAERISLAATGAPGTATIPHLWINGKEPRLTRLLRESPSVKLNTAGRSSLAVQSPNVAGYIAGSDPALKDEYILVTAHYDHIGTGKQAGRPYAAGDSIFNGARDNAFGVVAMLSAAESLAKIRPKRSVVFIAFTGEELGLLGSRYYAEHPLLPLKNCIFTLNSDGAGYNDTRLLSVLGFKRTGAAAQIEAAAKKFGLEIVADPAPEQGLFDRSDNVHFAVKGIPAPTLSPGFREFDAALMKNYHQASDNPETIDFDYLVRFSGAFTYAARLVANLKNPPRWEAGDKYEEAAKALYGY